VGGRRTVSLSADNAKTLLVFIAAVHTPQSQYGRTAIKITNCFHNDGGVSAQIIGSQPATDAAADTC